MTHLTRRGIVTDRCSSTRYSWVLHTQRLSSRRGQEAELTWCSRLCAGLSCSLVASVPAEGRLAEL